jgi:transposase InsO family protein
MSRVGNLYDNAKAESFMKTLKEQDQFLVLNHQTRVRFPVALPNFKLIHSPEIIFDYRNTSIRATFYSSLS